MHTGVLDTLTAELLDESIGEMITANPRQHTLEIYARKAAVPLLLARLDELVQTVVTRSVSVEDFDPKLLRKDALDELARVTKTVIKHSRETKVNTQAAIFRWTGADQSLATRSLTDRRGRLPREHRPRNHANRGCSRYCITVTQRSPNTASAGRGTDHSTAFQDTGRRFKIRHARSTQPGEPEHVLEG